MNSKSSAYACNRMELSLTEAHRWFHDGGSTGTEKNEYSLEFSCCRGDFGDLF